MADEWCVTHVWCCVLSADEGGLVAEKQRSFLDTGLELVPLDHKTPTDPEPRPVPWSQMPEPGTAYSFVLSTSSSVAMYACRLEGLNACRLVDL